MVESSRDNSLIACPTSPALGLDLPQVDPCLLHRGFCFLKNRGKEGKAEKRERRKNGKGGKSARQREKRRKPLPDFCRNMAPALGGGGGGGVCTAMPACWAVEQRILKMAFLNFNNPNK